jgi:hypothetical protein
MTLNKVDHPTEIIDMAMQPPTDEIFPQHTKKTFALAEVMRGEGPMVGKGPDDTVFAFPVVLIIELLLLLGVTLAIFLFSLMKQAPLEEIANPMITTDPAKAPWYFVGLQELLEHMHPTLAGVIIPGVLVAFLIALPYLDHSRAGAGVWFTSARGKRIVGWTALYAALIMPTYAVLDNFFSLRELLRSAAPQWVAQGLIPGLIIALIVVIPVARLFLTSHGKPEVREIMLTLFTVMFVSAIVLTLIGLLFRGPGFKLYWPWAMPNNYNPFDSF